VADPEGYTPTGIQQFLPVKNSAITSLLNDKLFIQKRFLAKMHKTVWRPGSVWARRGSLRRSPIPTAGLKRAALWQGSTGKGWHGKDNGEERRDHLLPSVLESAVAYMSRSFCLGYGPEAKRVTIGAPLERNQPLCSPGAFNGLRRMSSDMCTDTASWQ